MFGLDFQSLFGKRTHRSPEFFSGKKKNRTRDSGGSRARGIFLIIFENVGKISNAAHGVYLISSISSN